MLTIVVQAGGESRRMGQDKALLPFLGKPLITRVISRVADLADEVLVTMNTPENYSFLGLPLVSDVYPGRGALGGLYTALNAASQPFVGVVACDMPFVNPDLLKAELDLLVHTGCDTVMPQVGDGTEPFHAVYRRDACLPAIRAALQAEKWRVNSWFADVNMRYLSPEEILEYDPRQLAFWNVNTPEEFRRAEQMAAEGA
jgi:molybdopterin-guanine dinucleotide biosynthesis protein A